MAFIIIIIKFAALQVTHFCPSKTIVPHTYLTFLTNFITNIEVYHNFSSYLFKFTHNFTNKHHILSSDYKDTPWNITKLLADVDALYSPM